MSSLLTILSEATPLGLLARVPQALLIVTFTANLLATLWTALRYVKAPQEVKEIFEDRPRSNVHRARPAKSASPPVVSAGGDPFMLEFLGNLSAGCLRTAMSLVHDMRAIGGQSLNPSFYRLLLQYSARHRSPKSCFDQVVEDMLQHCCQRDSAMECYRVQYIARTGDAREANSALQELISRGFQPDLRTFERLMVCCLQTRMHNEVKTLFDDLDTHGLQPSPTMYAILISSYGQSGAVASSLAALEQMKVDFEGDMDALHLGYTSALHAAARNHCMGKVASLFGEFTEARLLMDAQLLTVLLVTAAQTDSAELAMTVISSARAAQIPDLNGLVLRLLEPLRLRPGSEAAVDAILATLA